MGVPTGGNLGAAQGSITINTAQAQQAVPVMQGVANGINRAMGTVNANVVGAQNSLNSMLGAVRGVGAALGVTFGAQTLGQLARFAVEASQIATAFDRQSVAARSLAGSQSELNDLLEAYHRATGNAIDDATALSDVTRLMSVGFADNVKEVEEFTRAVRGISLATGRPQEFIVTQLQLEMLNQTGFRLDQVGLGMEEVRKRADALRTANKSLTAEQAYQQAVLITANEKFGDLTKSAEAQASGVEALTRAWKDFRLEVGQTTQGPLDAIGKGAALFLDFQTARLRAWVKELDFYIVALRQLGMAGPWLTSGERAFVSSSAARDRGRHGRGSAPGATPIDDGTGAIRQDWAQGVLDLQRRTNQDLAQQNEDYQRQRAASEEDYQQTLLREAQDFASQRQRQEQELADSITDIREDAARREARAAEDLARNIGRMQSDSAERLADVARDRDERITEAREDSQERLVEMEEDYNEAREKAAENHRLKLLEAAGRLDAKAIYLEQQRFAQQEKDAKESYDEQRDDVKEKLAEQLDEINKSYARRVEDEQKALAKSIAQAQEAHARQLADARAADAQRIADMQEDFAKRTAQEDADRAIRLQRMAEDHQDQLDEMDRAHGDRIAQIIRHAQEERAQLDEEAKQALLDLKVKNAAWEAEQARKEEELEKLWDKFWGHVTDKINAELPPGAGGEDALPPGFAGISSFMPSSGFGGMSVAPVAAASAFGAGGSGRSISIGDIQVSVAGSNASANDIGSAVRYHLGLLLEEVAG